MEKKYQVYSVDTCFEEYAMEYQLIGAESVEDLLLHLKDCKTVNKKAVNKIRKEAEWRIREIPHLYTDVPYIGLDSYGYCE